MEPGKNIISSEAKLSAIAWVMFFAPFVKSRIKSDLSITDEERTFISWYTKIWLANLVLLGVVLIACLVNLFLANWILSWVVTIWSMIIFVTSIVSVFACINNLPMWTESEPLRQNIQHKWQILKSYMPILNFSLWFRQENYNMPYRWLKESTLLRTFFIFGTLLLGNSFGFWFAIAIIIRVVLLLLNIDIIPLSIKKAMNSIFSCNPWEMFAYIFAPLTSKLKKADYETILQAKKLWYMQWQKFWVWIMIQYVLFLGILFLLYRWIDISLNNILLFIAIIFWIIRIFLFYIHKKMLLKIPILSEVVSLVFS